MILVIDNYDSFTYNLVQYLGELGAELEVRRNDAVTLDEIEAMAPSHIVISPGPGTPLDGGISLDLIRTFHTTIPILGVCLGHQCIAAAFGGRVDRAPRLMHGKTSPVYHDGQGILGDVPSPFNAMRYHSLLVHDPLPDCLQAVAHTAEGEMMALRHETSPLIGLQFHPESILTEHGKTILANFLENRAVSFPERLASAGRNGDLDGNGRRHLRPLPQLPGSDLSTVVREKEK
jgi:anthranilate synthase/aminodeoxychorismate synthase-like glutamine amidotransferase